MGLGGEMVRASRRRQSVGYEKLIICPGDEDGDGNYTRRTSHLKRRGWVKRYYYYYLNNNGEKKMRRKRRLKYCRGSLLLPRMMKKMLGGIYAQALGLVMKKKRHHHHNHHHQHRLVMKMGVNEMFSRIAAIMSMYPSMLLFPSQWGMAVLSHSSSVL